MQTDSNQLLLHVGYHKTGTTWLQRSLFDHCTRGFYPLSYRSRKKVRSVDLTRPFVSDENGSSINPLGFHADSLRSRFELELNWRTEGIPVVSSEQFTGNPHSGGFDQKSLAERLHAVFPNAKVFMVVREQNSMIMSTYFQYLLGGGIQSLDRYINEPFDGRLPMFSKHYFQYHFLIDHYQKLFGRDNVLVLPYELFRRAPKNFISQLATFSGARIPNDLPFESQENAGRNRVIEYHLRILAPLFVKSSLNSYSPIAIPRARWSFKTMKAALGKLVPDSMHRKFVAAKRAEIASYTDGFYDESNKLTSQLIGTDLSEYGYSMGPQMVSRQRDTMAA
ncbi:Sulfotransferase domain-containing protein [Neorhodopirellula lusitana]|uniref:Sulfotransferase domain-containing protein n=1 Tax=Neorhodopirellula lusitana TaxID=445327 RepID=A0ABY1PVB3_9BACT|nr:sulfotransferase [Neorhodopirellula lusitana]SMP47730.1 Sulfotransferase domain-containing protein [Neorhodopirellula lusitana]